jgi:hypothetical protein
MDNHLIDYYYGTDSRVKLAMEGFFPEVIREVLFDEAGF